MDQLGIFGPTGRLYRLQRGNEQSEGADMLGLKHGPWAGHAREAFHSRFAAGCAGDGP